MGFNIKLHTHSQPCRDKMTMACKTVSQPASQSIDGDRKNRKAWTVTVSYIKCVHPDAIAIDAFDLQWIVNWSLHAKPLQIVTWDSTRTFFYVKSMVWFSHCELLYKSNHIKSNTHSFVRWLKRKQHICSLRDNNGNHNIDAYLHAFGWWKG